MYKSAASCVAQNSRLGASGKVLRKMQLLTALAVIAAVGLVAADYNTVKVADEEFLLKQKKIYNLLYHIAQPSFVNPTLYEEGCSYNIEANIDSYTNTTAVKSFLQLYEYGVLARGEINSIYYPKHLKETEALFRLFYYAKDFDTFYKTALWARVYMNEMQYMYAIFIAVTRREDTKFIQLPPIHEMYPYAFFNSEVLKKAQHAKLFGKPDSKKLGSYIIPANYSAWYISHEYDLEHKLNYFTEDIGLNAYYFYFRNDNPFWLKSEEFGLEQKWRGAVYFYGHKLLLTRYYLERLSNDMGKIEDFDWHNEFYTGYYPTMNYHNGLPLPQRPYWSKFPYYKYAYIKNLEDMESRVSAVIDSGFVLDATGKLINIYTPEGLNILGNIIEGNMDSCNRDFYGSIDLFARKVLGYNLEPSTSYQIIPSAFEFYSTSMRDPAFYRLYKRIFKFYHNRYKVHQKPYNKDEIIYPELKIESFVVDKLITFFDQFDSSISNGLIINNAEEAEKTLVKIRQYRLNHKPFSFHLSINAEKPIKAAIRIFLGPKYNAHHKPLDIAENAYYFYEMDNWIVDLNAGANKIVRNSQDCVFVIPDPEPSEVFYKKILKALNGSDTLSYTECLYGFPERLLLPKGKKDGMPFQIFVYVSPVEGEPIPYMSRIFGGYKFDEKPLGFPLDKPILNFRYNGSNMMLKDIMIYHKDEMELNVTY